ncbi:hypothetical protein PpBr36_05235 [Pyricularia pennisetigena]|uniref:hypothetical protein n=1 Tax=Pyricularia pennisetigena TaxID=1578925 RepID=UPI001153B51C|nr:hypothetical protein PpBr36_05235 [Pyricularia pennisetigena]TLS26108.1 hypothetical protein PpBr36_05235 [Pyricularia pennisetigena]
MDSSTSQAWPKSTRLGKCVSRSLPRRVSTSKRAQTTAVPLIRHPNSLPLSIFCRHMTLFAGTATLPPDTFTPLDDKTRTGTRTTRAQPAKCLLDQPHLHRQPIPHRQLRPVSPRHLVQILLQRPVAHGDVDVGGADGVRVVVGKVVALNSVADGHVETRLDKDPEAARRRRAHVLVPAAARRPHLLPAAAAAAATTSAPVASALQGLKLLQLLHAALLELLHRLQPLSQRGAVDEVVEPVLAPPHDEHELCTEQIPLVVVVEQDPGPEPEEVTVERRRVVASHSLERLALDGSHLSGVRVPQLREPLRGQHPGNLARGQAALLIGVPKAENLSHAAFADDGAAAAAATLAVAESPVETHDVPKLGDLGVAHDLVQPGLAAGDDGALGPQPGQGERHLLAVAAADAIGEHVDAVPGAEEVERRLRHADVALDPDQRHRDPAAAVAAHEVARRQRPLHRRRPHGEFRLVRVLSHQRACRRQELVQLRHRRPELGPVLRRRVDGNGEQLGGPNDLLAPWAAVVAMSAAPRCIGGALLARVVCLAAASDIKAAPFLNIG